METRIYVSNKIQKNYKKILLNPLPEKSDMGNHQNSWNANYIAILGKKCWLLTHSQTRYTVIVPDVKVKDIEQFLNCFLENMINQLTVKQFVDLEKIQKLIGEVKFYPTNNDKSCIAYNNKRIEDIEYWKHEFDDFNKISFGKIGANINELGSMLKNGKSIYLRPTTEMLDLINATA